MAGGMGYIQARELRNATAKEALALLAEPPETGATGHQDRQRRAMAVTSLVKAWEAASDRMRIARGVPLPGSRRPGPTRPARQSARRGLSPDQQQQPPPPDAADDASAAADQQPTL